MRMLIGDLVSDQIEEVSTDELPLLYFARGLAQRSGRADLFERPLKCLQPYLPRIEERREEEPPAAGLPGLVLRVGVYTPAGLKAAEARDVRLFAGIDHPIRGPLLIRRGLTKVVGGIPSDTTLVVEEGSCYVNGVVIGSLAATDSCEIAGNVSGVVIARRGDVRAGTLLNHCTVISKEGSVVATAAQDPKLVFGCREVKITGDTHGGTVYGRKVTVNGQVTGGMFHASEWLRAGRFACGEGDGLVLVLRRGLSCEDYGEQLCADARVQLMSAVKLRQQLMNIERMSEIQAREADEYAGSVLLFLLGEDETAEPMQRTQQLRRRVAFLDRLVTAIQSLVMVAEDKVNAGDESDSGAGSEDRSAIDDLRRELSQLANEGAMDRDLHEKREEVIQLGMKLQRRGISVQGVMQLMERLLEEGTRLRKDRDDIVATIDQIETKIGAAIGRTALIERAKAECTRAEMLEQLVAAARKRGGSDPFYRRTQDRFVRIMRRNIENRLSQASGSLVHTRELEDRIERARTRLWEVFGVSLPDHVLAGWSLGGVRAEGLFEAGVRLVPWKHLIEGGREARKDTVVAEDSEGERHTYLRTLGGTIERA